MATTHIQAAEQAELQADLVLAMAAIRQARIDHSRAGGRTGSADVAEIRAGRFLANHGEKLLALVAQGGMKVAA